MADVKAIELKGIVHNATKIGVQDGQAEDIVNLRLKDGAWRAAGDGKLLNIDVSGYTDIYIHTNVYRHMLGVQNGKLYWFATADASDPNAFKAISRKELCTVSGDITITQNGNLINVICETGMTNLLFINGESYKIYNTQHENKIDDVNQYPFGNVRFGIHRKLVGAYNYTADTLGAVVASAKGKAVEKNLFVNTFFVCLAVELYDGSYSLATCPVYIGGGNDAGYFGMADTRSENPAAVLEFFTDGDSSKFRFYGHELCIDFGDTSKIRGNENIFNSVCVFVTQTYDMVWMNSSASYGIAEKLNVAKTSPFYLLKRIRIEDLPTDNDGKFMLVDLSTSNSLTDNSSNGSSDNEGLMANIVHQDTLNSEAFYRSKMLPKMAYSYNARTHIAGYKTIPYVGYPISFNRWWHLVNDSYGDAGYTFSFNHFQIPAKDDIPSTIDYPCKSRVYVKNDSTENVIYTVESNAIDSSCFSVAQRSFCWYPDIRAKRIEFFFCSYYSASSTTADANLHFYKVVYNLNPHTYLGVAFGISESGTGTITPSSTIYEITESEYTAVVVDTDIKIENSTNVIRVSQTDNPLIFPVANTYQIGSSEIVAMCANAIAVGTGQTGDAPLYVFCKDGVYALFVDSSGQMTYTNARVIARDVCNNAKSVTPVDAGVVFTTDRGLMMIAGSEVIEIGQPLEGDYSKFAVIGNLDYDRVCRNAFRLSQLADLKEESLTQTDFIDYLKNAIVAYNHNERELMICNLFRKPNGRLYYDYMYVLDRNGNWTRRDYSADQFVENYPVTFRVADGRVYQMDEQSDADNGIFALSNVIKLDSIGFKAIDRVVARGLFETTNGEFKESVSINTGDSSARISINVKSGVTIKITPNNSDAYGVSFIRPDGTKTSKNTSGGVRNFTVTESFVACEITNESENRTHHSFTVEYHVSNDVYVGIYAFGSYDGRKWSCLGHKEKKGNFTDLGCNVERTDCKFFRFLLAGQITKESRLDYFEVSAKQSRLSTKIR